MEKNIKDNTIKSEREKIIEIGRNPTPNHIHFSRWRKSRQFRFWLYLALLLLLTFYLTNICYPNIVNYMIIATVNEDIKLEVKVVNQFGKTPFLSLPFNFENMVKETFRQETELNQFYQNYRLLELLQSRYQWIRQKLDLQGVGSRKKSVKESQRTRITLGAIACGERYTEAMTMLKSAALFSQDADLHIVLFSNEEAIFEAALDMLELKWTANSLGWRLTFELQLEWFPENEEETAVNVNWKEMYVKCATQRLFFPSLLPHIDALIYLDSDALILSNLTEFWMEMTNKMGNTKLAGAAANSEDIEDGIYGPGSHIPYYGKRGLNAGVMLMNLTQMREWDFQGLAVETQAEYKDQIVFADQDIINIIFNKYPDKVVELDCTYNFNWIHCGGEQLPCYDSFTGENVCFCSSAKTDGVKVLHGNSGTFYSEYFQHLFLPQAYNAFEKLDLIEDSYVTLIRDLKNNFNNLVQQPCHPLTAELLYKNAETYLKSQV